MAKGNFYLLCIAYKILDSKMATVAQAVKAISKAAKWSETDLRHRARWLIEAEEITPGKGGYGGAGAHKVNVKDLVTLILSMAVPVAKQAPRYIKKFRNLKTTEVDGLIWRLEDAMIDRIAFWGDLDRIKASEVIITEFQLWFDEKSPEANFIYEEKDRDDGVQTRLNFPSTPPKERIRTDLADCKMGIKFGPMLFYNLWLILTGENPTTKKSSQRRKRATK